MARFRRTPSTKLKFINPPANPTTLGDVWTGTTKPNPESFARMADGDIDGQREIDQLRSEVWQLSTPVEQATSLPQRGLRLLEEAIEAFRAAGGGPEMAHQLVDYVFARAVSELRHVG